MLPLEFSSTLSALTGTSCYLCLQESPLLPPDPAVGTGLNCPVVCGHTASYGVLTGSLAEAKLRRNMEGPWGGATVGRRSGVAQDPSQRLPLPSLIHCLPFVT